MMKDWILHRRSGEGFCFLYKPDGVTRLLILAKTRTEAWGKLNKVLNAQG
jgi:hypothetical protein